MRYSVTLIITIGVLSTGISTENDGKYWKTYNKNNYNFRVSKNNRFALYNHYIPILTASSFAGIDQLKELQLISNHIKEIQPGAFNGLSNLETITIRRSNIGHLTAGIFNHLTITELTITDNGRPLIIASDSFDNMKNVQTIRLDRCQIKSWNPKWFFNTPSLRNIFANENLLREIPANAFQNVNSEQEFNLLFYNNNISAVSDSAFKGIRKINYLHLGSNNIQDFTGGCFQNISINILALDHNKITWFPPTKFAQIFVANVTYIEGNSFNRFYLQGLIYWARGFKKTVVTTE